MPKITEQMYDEKRKFILDSARQVFAKHGYEGATIKDILCATGISNGALFVYFKSKRDILLAIIEQNLGAFRMRVDAIVEISHEHSRDEVFLMLLELVRQISLGPGRAMSLHAWSASMVDPVVKECLDKHFNALIQSFSLLARKLRDHGQLGQELNPNRAGHAIFSFIIPGYILQLLMFPVMEPRTYLNAHRSVWCNQ
jgi:AcrR family transcriptional regulator